MQKEREYKINGDKVSFDLFQKFLCWVKNSSLTYSLVEHYDALKNTIVNLIIVDQGSIVAFMEKIADYNERLEQRLNKLL